MAFSIYNIIMTKKITSVISNKNTKCLLTRVARAHKRQVAIAYPGGACGPPGYRTAFPFFDTRVGPPGYRSRVRMRRDMFRNITLLSRCILALLGLIHQVNRNCSEKSLIFFLSKINELEGPNVMLHFSGSSMMFHAHGWFKWESVAV